jgi:PRTRC genetic system protein C
MVTIPRVFVIDGKEVADPAPKLSVLQVKSLLTSEHPSLTNSEISGPVTKDDKQIYTFESKVGTKG